MSLLARRVFDPSQHRCKGWQKYLQLKEPWKRVPEKQRKLISKSLHCEPEKGIQKHLACAISILSRTRGRAQSSLFWASAFLTRRNKLLFERVSTHSSFLPKYSITFWDLSCHRPQRKRFSCEPWKGSAPEPNRLPWVSREITVKKLYYRIVELIFNLLLPWVYFTKYQNIPLTFWWPSTSKMGRKVASQNGTGCLRLLHIQNYQPPFQSLEDVYSNRIPASNSGRESMQSH